MLNTDQQTHFKSLVLKAAKVTGSTSLHIRVSGRQRADKTWCVGLIFGTKKASEWLHIADVPEADLPQAKSDYRALLSSLLAKQ